MAKTCTKCHLQSADTTSGYCKKCYKDYKHQHYLKNRDRYLQQAHIRKTEFIPHLQSLVWDYLSKHCCVDCRESDVIVLEFDHLNPLTKRNTISRLVAHGCAWQTIQVEIAKCEVVCANCHKRRTARRGGWYERKSAASSNMGNSSDFQSEKACSSHAEATK